MFTLKLYVKDTLFIRRYDSININRGQDALGSYSSEPPPYAELYCTSGEYVKVWPLYPTNRAYIVNDNGKTIEAITGTIE